MELIEEYKSKECKGCYIYTHCSIPTSIGNKSCPCITCLVKVMCYESCEELIAYCQYTTLEVREHERIRKQWA